MKRTPPPKRKLEDDFGESDSNPRLNDSGLAKKLNMSIEARKDLSLFDKNMFEAEYKSQFIRIASLEQELNNVNIEKKNLQNEFDLFKRSKAEEIRDVIEGKKELEKALKLCKTNENFLKSENERLTKVADDAEATRLPEKEKEIAQLKLQISSLIEESQDLKKKTEKEINDLKYDIESKSNEIEKLQSDLTNSNETLQSLNSKMDAVKKENCLLQNQIRDLEADKLKLQDNTSNLNIYIDQSKKIDDLEREIRNLTNKIDYYKKNEQENHLLQEDLNSKNKQIERLEKRIISIELDKSNLQEELVKLKFTSVRETTNELIESLNQKIINRDSDILRLKEKSENLDAEVRQLKTKLEEKESYIDQIHKQLARSNTERNCFKNMLDESDIQINASESETIKQLEKRIEQYEIMISNYKSQGEPLEIKLRNKSSMRLEETDHKSVGVQVNLQAKIFSNYENTIIELRNKIDQLTSIDSSNQSNESKENIDFNKQKEFLLKEFEKKSLEVLRACKLLFGFKLGLSENKVTLVSSKNKDNFIQFKLNPNNSLGLVDTQYLSKFTHYVDKYLKKMSSIPLFLAAIHLYETSNLEIEIISN